MKSKTAVFVLAASLPFGFFFLAGCASSPSSGDAMASAGTDGVSVTLLSESDLRSHYGRTPSDDPFLYGSPSVFAKNYDFVALQLTAFSSAGASLEILQAEARDENGKVRATFYNKEKFSGIADTQSFDEANRTVRQNKIDWYYLPSERMHLERGKSTYLLMLVGKHPLPPSLIAGVRLLFNGVEQDFTIPIPDADTESD